jgi:hypothetical protein
MFEQNDSNSRGMGRSHVIGKCNLAVFVADDWEVQLDASDLIDIIDPTSMRFDRVGGQTDQLDAPLVEFWLVFCKRCKLGGADGSVIFWMRKQDDPVVTDKFVKVDHTVGGLGFEIWGD